MNSPSVALGKPNHKPVIRGRVVLKASGDEEIFDESSPRQGYGSPGELNNGTDKRKLKPVAKHGEELSGGEERGGHIDLGEGGGGGFVRYARGVDRSGGRLGSEWDRDALAG